MKKIISLVLILALALSFTVMSVHAEEEAVMPTADTEVIVLEYPDVTDSQRMAAVWAEAEEADKDGQAVVDGADVGRISTKERGEHLSGGITNGYHEDEASWTGLD